MTNRLLNVKAVLFDFDGTLTQPGALDFSIIRKAIGCPADRPVLEVIENLRDVEHRSRAFPELDRFERACAVKAQPNSGAEDLLLYLMTSPVLFISVPILLDMPLNLSKGQRGIFVTM